MPTIGNVKHDSSLTPNFFRSKVGLGHRFQYGDRRRRPSTLKLGYHRQWVASLMKDCQLSRG